MIWDHDALAADLANYLRNGNRMVWTDMQLGPSGSCRPDVFTLEKSFSQPSPRAFECKISLSDFRSDVTSGKYQKYFSYAGNVTFAVPAGLIDKKDLPERCGLMIRGENGWKSVKRATLSRVQLDQDCWMKLLIDGVSRLPRTIGPRESDVWNVAKAVRKRHGDEVARILTDLSYAREDLKRQNTATEELRQERQKIVREIQHIKEAARKEAIASLDEDEAFIKHYLNELKAALGIATDSSKYELIRAITKVRAVANEDERLKLALSMIDETISRAQNSRSAIEGMVNSGA